MADVILALERLIDRVRADFLESGIQVPHLFGWRQVAQKTVTGTRVVWVPGDDQSGDLGTLGPARYPGRNPRSYATLHELVTVRIVAFDPDHPEDETKQYRAARLLFDAWYAAVHRAVHGNFSIPRSQWLIDTRERRAGATIRVVLELQAAVMDQLVGEIPAGDLTAEIGLQLKKSPEPPEILQVEGQK